MRAAAERGAYVCGEGEPDLNVALLEAVDIGVAYCRLYAGRQKRATGVFEGHGAFIGRGSVSRWRRTACA